MTINDIIEELKLRANEAEYAMAVSANDSDTNYNEGRSEAYGAMVGFLEAEFCAPEPRH
tara:strand:+ start:3378 stop:3554 length:177 start_codon:yes stop_codon:yes gene_type:complete